MSAISQISQDQLNINSGTSQLECGNLPDQLNNVAEPRNTIPVMFPGPRTCGASSGNLLYLRTVHGSVAGTDEARISALGEQITMFLMSTDPSHRSTSFDTYAM